jgi:hypothetical protein
MCTRGFQYSLFRGLCIFTLRTFYINACTSPFNAIAFQFFLYLTCREMCFSDRCMSVCAVVFFTYGNLFISSIALSTHMLICL